LGDVLLRHQVGRVAGRVGTGELEPDLAVGLHRTGPCEDHGHRQGAERVANTHGSVSSLSLPRAAGPPRSIIHPGRGTRHDGISNFEIAGELQPTSRSLSRAVQDSVIRRARSMSSGPYRRACRAVEAGSGDEKLTFSA